MWGSLHPEFFPLRYNPPPQCPWAPIAISVFCFPAPVIQPRILCRGPYIPHSNQSFLDILDKGVLQ